MRAMKSGFSSSANTAAMAMSAVTAMSGAMSSARGPAPVSERRATHATSTTMAISFHAASARTVSTLTPKYPNRSAMISEWKGRSHMKRISAVRATRGNRTLVVRGSGSADVVIVSLGLPRRQLARRNAPRISRLIRPRDPPRFAAESGFRARQSARIAPAPATRNPSMRPAMSVLARRSK